MGRRIATGHQKADRLQRLQAALNLPNDSSMIRPGKSLLYFGVFGTRNRFKNPFEFRDSPIAVFDLGAKPQISSTPEKFKGTKGSR
jgi:hypothetical protein